MNNTSDYSEEDKERFFENFPDAGNCSSLPNFLSPPECDELLAYFKPDKITIGTINKTNDINYNIRRNRVQFLKEEKHPELSWLFERINTTIRTFNDGHSRLPLKGLQNNYIQLSIYNKDDFYSWHQDSGHGMKRQISFSIQLSKVDTYQGGDLQLLTREGVKSSEKKAGSLSIFTSSTVHRVMPITKGTRYSLVGWFL